MESSVIYDRRLSQLERAIFTLIGADINDLNSLSVLLQIRTGDEDVIIADLINFLQFIDRSIGLVANGNLLSYSLQRNSLARINKISQGSVVFEILEPLASHLSPGIILAGMAIMKLPAIIKAAPEGIKHLAESYKLTQEGREIAQRIQKEDLADALPSPHSLESKGLLAVESEDRFALAQQKVSRVDQEAATRRAKRKFRAELNKIDGFSALNAREKKLVADQIWAIVMTSADHLPKTAHFLEDQVVSITLTLQPKDQPKNDG